MMTAKLHSVVVARTRMDVAALDYRRTIKQLAASGASQSAIARAAGVSQPSVHDALKRGREVAEPVEGFAGVSPFEIAQRYAAGLLERHETIQQLAHWKYTPAIPPEGHDDLSFDQPGGWGEVELACDRGLLDDDLVDEVQAEQERLGLG